MAKALERKAWDGNLKRMTIGKFLLGIFLIGASLFVYLSGVPFVYITYKLDRGAVSNSFLVVFPIVIMSVLMFLLVFILGTLILIEALEILGYQKQVNRFLQFVRHISSFFKKEIGHD